MGFKVLGFSLLIIIIYLINLASSYPIQKTFPSEKKELLQKSKIEDKGIHGVKLEGGSNHGGNNGGRAHGDSPNTQGGAAVIPVYAGAAAANRNHQPQNHHGAANCNLNKIKFPTMLMITFVYPLIL